MPLRGFFRCKAQHVENPDGQNRPVAMQGEDWSPFVVTDSKMITGQNPQVIAPHTAGNWHTHGCSIALL